MTAALNIKSNFRYERKFTTLDVERAWLLAAIRNHPAFFREVFHPRQINNIYFDTADRKFYFDNVDGVSVRKKVRIRWYCDTFGHVQNPVLEYKLKNNLLGDKWSFKLPEVKIKPATPLKMSAFLSNAHLPEPIAEDLKILRPTLLNHYRRTYFLSADNKFRLTFDEQLFFHDYQPNQKSFHAHNRRLPAEYYIIELKYQPEQDKLANAISKRFPFRLDKSSKYVTGIDLLQ